MQYKPQKKSPHDSREMKEETDILWDVQFQDKNLNAHMYVTSA